MYSIRRSLRTGIDVPVRVLTFIRLYACACVPYPPLNASFEVGGGYALRPVVDPSAVFPLPFGPLHLSSDSRPEFDCFRAARNTVASSGDSRNCGFWVFRGARDPTNNRPPLSPLG